MTQRRLTETPPTSEADVEVNGIMLAAGLRAARRFSLAEDPLPAIVSAVYRAMRVQDPVIVERSAPDDAPQLEILHIRGRPYAAERDLCTLLTHPPEDARAAIERCRPELESMDPLISYLGQYYLTEPQIYRAIREMMPDDAARICTAINIQFMRWQRWYGVYQRMREAANSIVHYTARLGPPRDEDWPGARRAARRGRI